ncbi:hypothetical protein B0T16DRAFT_414984 [Cercophora newfieldiana]|uniref:Uncharacterized protein n=1 Tax=Cercophora newfieldiana TaxID=92897 RepID=A0AA39XZ21_9PEZI|nr:hypothetical protein B0T16DRAFT_414984 [Cercophora newfieldiana]
MNFTPHLPPNATNCTFHLPEQDGTAENTLSSGSAAFITIALIFGCMSQLPGSLVTGEGNRFWRISPFLSLTEAIIILVRIAVPLYNRLCTLVRRYIIPDGSTLHLDASERQGRVSLKVMAYALLAERLGNSRKYNYWLRQQWKESAPTLEQIVSLLDAVSSLERGTTLRPIVIVPMVLQLAKLSIIEASWTSVKLLPLMYFWSWLSVEFLLLMVHGDKLSEMDMLEAERILLLSVAPTEITTPSERGAARPEASSIQPPEGSAESSEPCESPDLVRHWQSEVAIQTRALLSQTVGPENVPQNRVTFRGSRVKLSRMQGDASNLFWQYLAGIMALFLESLYTVIFIWIAAEDHIPTWLFITFYFCLVLVIPLMLVVDYYMASLIVGIVERWLGRPWEDESSGMRDWTALRTMVCILVYYSVLYDESGTRKPSWLDWLG